MSDIKDRINKITEYFVGMQVEDVDGEKVVYVKVRFPKSWAIDEEIPNKFNVSVADSDEGEGVHYFCASMDDGFEAVFNAIDYNIDKMKTAQERAVLFREKVNELKKLFEDETISIKSLRTVDFTYKGKKKKILVPQQPKENNNEQETVEENE